MSLKYWDVCWFGVEPLRCSLSIITRATLASARIIAVVCLSVCLSVRPSVTSQRSTATAKVAKRRITRTTPHDSPGTLVFCRRKSRQNSNRVTLNGGAKCRWGRLNAGAVRCKLATFDAKYCQLSSVASLSHWASALFVCSTFAVMQRVLQVCQRQLIVVCYWVTAKSHCKYIEQNRRFTFRCIALHCIKRLSSSVYITERPEHNASIKINCSKPCWNIVS